MGLAAVIWSQSTTPKKLCQSGEQNERERERLSIQSGGTSNCRGLSCGRPPRTFFSRGGEGIVCGTQEGGRNVGAGGVGWGGVARIFPPLTDYPSTRSSHTTNPFAQGAVLGTGNRAPSTVNVSRNRKSDTGGGGGGGGFPFPPWNDAARASAKDRSALLRLEIHFVHRSSYEGGRVPWPVTAGLVPHALARPCAFSAQ